MLGLHNTNSSTHIVHSGSATEVSRPWFFPIRMGDFSFRGFRQAWAKRQYEKSLLELMAALKLVDPALATAWERVTHSDEYVGMQMLASRTFGLRGKEAVSLRPVAGFNGQELAVENAIDGTFRSVRVRTEFQRSLIPVLQFFVLSRAGDRNTRLAGPDKSVKDGLMRYHAVLARHGLFQIK